MHHLSFLDCIYIVDDIVPAVMAGLSTSDFDLVPGAARKESICVAGLLFSFCFAGMSWLVCFAYLGFWNGS